jgi:predicted phosphatase
MKEVIVLLIWVNGAGYNLAEADSWNDCQEAMTALDKLNLETTCHLFEMSIRPKRRPSYVQGR